MKTIMTLKWCVFTGALMLAAVWFTFSFKQEVREQPGVYTRWYDGTTERVDSFYPNGKLQSTTVYGDDGQTVLIQVLCNEDGVIVSSTVRQADGKLLMKQFSPDGKVLISKALYLSDGTTAVERYEFTEKGEPRLEIVMTEDGRAPVRRKIWDDNGKLMLESHTLDNADQVSDKFQDGVRVMHELFKANGDVTQEFYVPKTDRVIRRLSLSRLTGDTTIVWLDKSGETVYERIIPGGQGDNPKTMINSVIVHGKPTVRQTNVEFNVRVVEQFAPGTNRVTRKVTIDENGRVTGVYFYRADGTLLRVKNLKDGVVVTTDEYDATGSKVIRTLQGGEPEAVPRELLLPVLPPQPPLKEDE